MGKSIAMLGLTFFGVGIIGEAIDALEVFDAIDLTDIDELDTNFHYVEPHSVEGYMREDGTFVNGYERGGEDGYLRSNPDDSFTNNLV